MQFSRLTSKIFFFQMLSFLKYLIKIIISWFENISCRSVRICTSVSSIPGARRSAPLTYCSHHSLYTRFFLSSYSTAPFHFISSNQSNILFSYSNIRLISRYFSWCHWEMDNNARKLTLCEAIENRGRNKSLEEREQRARLGRRWQVAASHREEVEKSMGTARPKIW